MFVKGSVEDYIYILIGIIWIAFSIYKGIKGSQKKRTPSQIPDEDRGGTHDYAEETRERKPAKSVFDTFLEEITREDEPLPYKPVEINEKDKEATVQPDKKIAPEPFSYDDFYEESNYLDETGVYEERAATKPTKQEDLTTYLKKTKRPRIDLKKAVIYSEILNRRYF